MSVLRFTDEDIDSAVSLLNDNDEEKAADNAVANTDLGKAKLAVGAAQSISPDKAAEQKRVADKLGAPTAVVENAYDEAVRLLGERDAENALRDRPRTQRFLSDVNRAKVIKAKIIMKTADQSNNIDKSNLIKVNEEEFIEDFLPKIVCSDSNCEVVDKVEM